MIEEKTNKPNNKLINITIIVLVILLIFLLSLFVYLIINSKSNNNVEQNINNKDTANKEPVPLNQNSKEEEVIEKGDKLVFIKKIEAYSIYQTEDSDSYAQYFKITDDKNEYYASRLTEYDKDYLFFNNGKGIVITNLKNSTIKQTNYVGLSCDFFSDPQYSFCLNNTMIGKIGNKYGVVSLITGEDILKGIYDEIAQDKNGNFLVNIDDKYGLYSYTGELLLDIKYDYLGYSDILGYLTILNEDFIVYDSEFKEIELSTNIEEEIRLTNSNSFFWSSGSIIAYHNISTSYKGEWFKYNGNEYSGNQLLIYDIYAGCYRDPIIYILEGNKAYKLNSEDIQVDNIGCF